MLIELKPYTRVKDYNRCIICNCGISGNPYRNYFASDSGLSRYLEFPSKTKLKFCTAKCFTKICNVGFARKKALAIELHKKYGISLKCK